MTAALRIHRPRFDLSPDQVEAVDVIDQWRGGWRTHKKQTMTLGGYAGCGKTTVIAYLAEYWPQTAVCAYCGKAANVLRNKGVDAQTIHSLIYVPYEGEGGAVRYRRRERLEGVDTIIVDEASMVDHLLHQDLLSFKVPILYVGDHGQLEPIGTNPNLMKDPETRLEKIHRQEMGNPIIRLATAFREGRPVPFWRDPEGRVAIVPRREVDSYLKAGAQIICGFNASRHRLNKFMREQQGFTGDLPGPGERIIVLQNNKKHGVFNGQQFTITYASVTGRRCLTVEAVSEDGMPAEFPCLIEQFGKGVVKDFRDQNVILADFAYAITGHKSQGSEYDDVLVLEEIAKVWNEQRWRYTVATRAKQRLVYCL